ncbi:hypothetical protein ACT7C8_18000 [Bacillus cereus]
MSQAFEVKIQRLESHSNVRKAGYKFYKNDNGYRGYYYDKDVIAMRDLIKYSKHPDVMTLEKWQGCCINK